MAARSSGARALAWTFTLALLWQLAMPWLASAAARWQDLPLAEVCSVYGVAAAREPLPADGPASGHPPGAATGDALHCPLSALAMLGPVGLPTSAAAVPHAGDDRLVHRPAQRPPHDAVAAWAARLRHAPPAEA